MGKEEIPGLLSQKEIDKLLNDISSDTLYFEDVEDIDTKTTKSLLKNRVKNKEDMYDLILYLVRDRRSYKEILEKRNKEITDFYIEVKAIKLFLNKILANKGEIEE